MHDEYYKTLWASANERIVAIFDAAHEDIGNIIAKDMPETPCDVKKLLCKVIRCGTPTEKASMHMAVTEWLHAWHELHEHKAAPAAK